jgi:hypothetical protein
MVKMIATKPFSFCNRTLQPGDRFVADDEQQASMLQTIGRASRETGEDEPSKKRFYKRRDMRAQD